jgi:tetratricopeptide (TPR) repeat protein
MYQHVLDIDPGNTTALAALGMVVEAQQPATDYVDLASLLDVEEQSGDTRYFVEEKEPTGDEDRDFAELLTQFKAKVSEHVSAEDAGAHYDLGLAFKEMGLVDEAIAEFQVALRAGDERLKIYEELGQCFMMKEQYNVATKVFGRALRMPHEDDLELIGVYYHMGRAFEELGQPADARDAYERVLTLDINFQDVSRRLSRL